MALRFKAGDIIEIVKYWDQGDDCWRSGVIMVTGWDPYDHTEGGCYGIEPISGDIHWRAVNAIYFDRMQYLIWLGNIEDNPTLKILYAPK